MFLFFFFFFFFLLFLGNALKYIHVCMCIVMYDCMGGCISCVVASLLAVCLLLTSRPGKMQAALSNDELNVVGGCRDLCWRVRFLGQDLEYLLSLSWLVNCKLKIIYILFS